MTEQTNGSNDNDRTSGQQTRVRGKYPRISLKEVLSIPKTVFELGQGEPIRRLSVFDSLGRSPSSSTSRTMVTASSTYGLTKGGYQASHLELTNCGRRLASPSSERDALDAAYDAMFGNEIFADFVDYWQDKAVPRNEVAIDWLKTNHEIPQQDAEAIWEVIRTNINDFGLTQDIAGKKLVASRDTALQSAGDSSATNNGNEETPIPNTDLDQETPLGVSVANSVSGQAVIPQIHFNVQIQLPENGSPEDYDAIFKSIGTYLLGHKDEQ